VRSQSGRCHLPRLMKQLSLCCSTLGWSCHHGDQNGWKRGFKRRNLWRWHRFCCTNGCNGNLWIEKGSVTISVGICFSIFLGLATITQSFQWLYRAKKNSWTNLILTPEVTYPYPTEQPFAIWFGPPNVTSLIHNYSIAWRLAFASCVSWSWTLDRCGLCEVLSSFFEVRSAISFL